MLPTILGIVFEGMKTWSEERRTRFLKKHHDLLEALKDAENKTYPNYNDADIDIINERLRIFLEAYWSELRKNDVAGVQQGKG